MAKPKPIPLRVVTGPQGHGGSIVTTDKSTTVFFALPHSSDHPDLTCGRCGAVLVLGGGLGRLTAPPLILTCNACGALNDTIEIIAD